MKGFRCVLATIVSSKFLNAFSCRRFDEVDELLELSQDMAFVLNEIDPDFLGKIIDKGNKNFCTTC